MQTDETVQEWLERAFGKLPGCDDELFQRLWGRGFLKYAGDKDTDEIDSYNARLACAAITKRGRLFIMLPDYEPRRPALLFATALLRYWFDHREVSIGQSRPVVYFGSAVGIRDQLRLSQVRDSNLDLAAIFQQQDMKRGRPSAQLTASDVATEGLLKSRLPEAVTVYAPADPVAVLKSIKPSFIALDVGDSDSLPWLEPLLSYAARTAIPIIGWGQNPLGESVDVFMKHCSVFQWPFKSVADSTAAQDDPSADTALGALLKSGSRLAIQPVVLEATGMSTFSDVLARAARALVNVGGSGGGPLLTDTIALHWRYLRAIETLCVPCDLYDAEAPRMWGLHSFPQLASTCERFRQACNSPYPASVKALEEVAALLDGTVEGLRGSEPPLWTALCNLCLEEQSKDSARVIAFPSHATKHLFQLSLLSRCNVSPDDLLELRVWLVSLYELRLRSPSRVVSASERNPLSSDMPDASLSWHPLVVGVPSPNRAADMSRLLRESALEFLVFQHQLPSLTRRVREWGDRLRPNIAGDLLVLGDLAGIRDVPDAPVRQGPLSTRAPVGVSVQTAKRQVAPQLERLLTLNEPVAEVSGLFDLESSDDTDEGPSIDRERNADPSEIEAYCDAAIAVQFSQGWQGLFAPDDSLNLIVSADSGVRTDERFVRALRPGDRVVLIHGARRQSLYELVIDRVHKHPAIELHLALIRRWREDFQIAFERWQSQDRSTSGATNPARTLDDLLAELRSRGSELVSPGTLYQWLQGWTLCPQDPQDVLRAADVLGMGFVKKYHKAIANAASRIRGLHRGLSNRLNRWLAEQAPGLAAKASDDMIDEELGLRFDDFRNSLIVADVVHVETTKGLFLRSRLGQISQGGN